MDYDLLYMQVVGGAHITGVLLAWTLAFFVYRARPHASGNQLLAGLLYAEGAFQGVSAALTFFGDEILDGGAPPPSFAIFAIALVALFVSALLYLVFLSTINTPLTRSFRKPGFRRGLVVAAVVHGLVAGHVFYYVATGRPDPVAIETGILFIVTVLMVAFASVYGLIACVSAWRRAGLGSEQRKRALAFVLAFGGRDVAILLHLLGGPILGNILFDESQRGEMFSELWLIVSQSFLGMTTVVFAIFLAYGFLRGQLFDIDLKIKLGIKRGTVVGLILGAFFAAAKITEAYLSREVGFVAGSIIAGLMLFLVPKLNRIGDKVANVAMPQVQPTNAYLSFKKMEVYRAALESAYETGGISDKEHATLDRLREKLGLTKADTEAVEMEVRPPAASSPAAAAA